MFLFFYAIRKFSNLKKNKTFLFFLFRDWYTFIYPFFLYQTVLKKHTKMKKRRLLVDRRYLDFTFFLFICVFLFLLPLLLLVLRSFSSFSFVACAGRRWMIHGKLTRNYMLKPCPCIFSFISFKHVRLNITYKQGT